LFAALALAAACFSPSDARAYSPFLVVPDPDEAEATPAYRYANMTDAEAFAELDKRAILYTRLGAVSGVRAPIRLTGRLHGVYIHSALPPDERVTSMFEILDARLCLALDDFAALLERHDIDEVVHYTMYRPNVAPPGAAQSVEHGVPDDAPKRWGHRAKQLGGPADKGHHKGLAPRPSAAPASGHVDGKAPERAPSKAPPIAPSRSKQKGAPANGAKSAETVSMPLSPRGRSPVARAGQSKAPARMTPAPKAPAPAPKTTWAPPGTRHPAGLAIDVGSLHKKGGGWLSVASQFHGSIGERTCGEGARVPDEPEARELRSLVCEAADLGIFTYVLTPDFNAAHVDHFHMEIKPGVRWFLYH
jgi:hypothetical protein